MTADRSLGQIGSEMSSSQQQHHDAAYDDISTTTDFDLDGLMIDYFSSLPESPTGGHRTSYFHSPNGARVETTTPESSSFHSNNTTTVELGGDGIIPSDSPEAWRLTNAVHMEVQENAKVPTFNWNIDRSNSVAKTFGIPTEIHHYVTKSSNDKATTKTNSTSNSVSPSKQPKPSMEFFFGREGKRGRASFNPSYANTGIFKHDTTSSRFGTAVSNNSNTNDLTVPFLPLTKPPITSSIPNSTKKDTTVSTTAAPVGGGSGTHFTAEDAAKLLELTRGIDPTPLSEIKRRHSPSGKPTTASAFTNISSEGNTTQQPSSSGFRFYVPKPSRPNPDSTSKNVNQSATIPVTITTTVPITNTNVNLSASNVGAIGTQAIGPNGSLKASAATSNTPMYQTAAATIKADRTSHFDNRSSRNRPTPLVSNTGAIKNEALQKSQYGFGTKHVVPSVPITKPAAALKPATKTARKSKGKEKLVTMAVPTHTTATTPSVTSLSPHSHHSHPTTNGTTHVAAYERKKARAKNARILINESIDRLSVAMTLAGTQSKQRGEQIEQMKKERSSLPLIRQAASKSPGSQQPEPLNSVSKIIPLSHGDTNIRNTIGDCIDIADNAKKWDRPSFIGSSASMIQAMNDQCESLMRELVACHTQNITILKHLHRLHRAQTVASISRSNSIVGDTDRRPKDEGTGAIQGVVKHELDEDTAMTNNEHPAKKLRTDEEPSDGLYPEEINDGIESRNEVMSAVLNERKIMDNIVQFLDVQTKATCLLRISKSWKCGLYFDTDPLWRDLCTERFGLFNVRQWHAKLEDTPHDNDPKDQASLFSRSSPSFVSSAALYRSMDTAHVMPHYQRSTNMVFLGEGLIPGKIVAWTFLIERSNGETMRSVLRPQEGVPTSNKKHTAPYTSLPVVQLCTYVQNIAIAYDEPIIVREQTFTVDSSTRRRKDEMKEIEWDERFRKRVLNLDGSVRACDETDGHSHLTAENVGSKELCRLNLFDTVIIETNIHAKGCVTTSKFIQKSNYAKLIVQVPTMTTIPLVIPFPRDSAHLQFE